MAHLPPFLTQLTHHRDAMIALLSTLVAAESPSDAPETQAGPQAILREQFAQLGYDAEYTPGTLTGGYLVARAPNGDGRPTQLLLGHCDTEMCIRDSVIAARPAQHVPFDDQGHLAQRSDGPDGVAVAEEELGGAAVGVRRAGHELSLIHI